MLKQSSLIRMAEQHEGLKGKESQRKGREVHNCNVPKTVVEWNFLLLISSETNKNLSIIVKSHHYK